MPPDADRRTRLMALLRSLAQHDPHASADVAHDVGDAAYAILYELGLDAHPELAVGSLLASGEEAAMIGRLVTALDEVLGFIGTCSIEERNMQHHGWSEVVASARAAYELFTAPDTPSWKG